MGLTLQVWRTADTLLTSPSQRETQWPWRPISELISSPGIVDQDLETTSNTFFKKISWVRRGFEMSGTIPDTNSVTNISSSIAGLAACREATPSVTSRLRMAAPGSRWRIREPGPTPLPPPGAETVSREQCSVSRDCINGSSKPPLNQLFL